jgi:hypothetical protein
MHSKIVVKYVLLQGSFYGHMMQLTRNLTIVIDPHEKCMSKLCILDDIPRVAAELHATI